VSAQQEFLRAVQLSELPSEVRASANQATAVEEHQFGQSYIDFLDEQIRLSPRGPLWTERLKARREHLLPFRDRVLLRGSVAVGKDSYTIEVDPKSVVVIHWERYEQDGRRT
jgi:hypothetical protein